MTAISLAALITCSSMVLGCWLLAAGGLLPPKFGSAVVPGLPGFGFRPAGRPRKELRSAGNSGDCRGPAPMIAPDGAAPPGPPGPPGPAGAVVLAAGTSARSSILPGLLKMSVARA